MLISTERFAQGLTYEQYKEQMTRNRERFDANEQLVKLDPADVAYFAGLPASLPVVVLAEDWCGDVINNLPVLGRLAEASGKLDVRVFLRDQNLDLMDQYLNHGQFRSIPVVVFFDEQFRELGHWIERPARVSELQAEFRRKLYAEDPVFAGIAPETSIGDLPEAARDRLRAAFATFREEHRTFSDQEVVRDFRALVEHGKTQSTPASVPADRPSTTSGIVAQSNGHASGATHSGVKVSITYCAECGYEPQTLDLAKALMYEFVHELSAIELIPWQDGAFDVTINGDLIHSMYRDGGFPEHATVVAAVRERLDR
jgi:selT/selW/selH-like putative selenoprotein